MNLDIGDFISGQFGTEESYPQEMQYYQLLLDLNKTWTKYDKEDRVIGFYMTVVLDLGEL